MGINVQMALATSPAPIRAMACQKMPLASPLPPVGERENAPRKTAWETPAAMKSEMPEPMPYFWMTSSR
ncbi:Uncharacterised protein [uncultured archaeon]|nr:Uncharacterised protein [uncultured archaeon]